MNTGGQYRTMRAVGMMLVLVQILLSAGCDRHRSILLPRQLEGVWTTEDPRYKDRFLELSQAFVIIVAGRDEPFSVQLVDRVETSQQGSQMLLTVYSTDHSTGEQYTMNLRFNPENGGELHFSNQPQVWKRRLPDPPNKNTTPANAQPPNGGKLQAPKRDPFSQK